MAGLPPLKLVASLQTLALATLAFDQRWGAAIAAVVQPRHFDVSHRPLVEAVLAYRKRHSQPPALQLAVLAASLRPGADNALHEQLAAQVLALRDGLNPEFVASKAAALVRQQTLKQAVWDASDRFVSEDEAVVADVERIFSAALALREHSLDAGTFLDDPRLVERAIEPRQFLSLNIPEFDRRSIGPAAKELLLYIAAKDTGKSWFCVHCGRQGLLHHRRVVHVTLEMTEDEVANRYHQNLFALSHGGGWRRSRLLGQDGKLIADPSRPDDKREPLDHFAHALDRPAPEQDLRTKAGHDNLRAQVKAWGTRLGNLVIKGFPTSSLTIDRLIGYLDYLADVKSFVPSILIVDYPKLMKLDNRDRRVSLGATMEELRGIAVTRNLALVAPHQGTRQAMDAKVVRSSMASEDISVVQTADAVLTYSRSEFERMTNMGRLSVEHARHAKGHFTVMLAQGYAIGQYLLQAELMTNTARDKLKQKREAMGDVVDDLDDTDDYARDEDAA